MNQTQGTREIELGELRDVLTLNDFIARKPIKVKLVLEEAEQNGLWQLSLYDLESTKTWQVGYYIDGYEDRRAIHKTLIMGWSGYYEYDAGTYDVKSYVIKLEGDHIVINLPDEWRPDYIIRAKRLCGYGFPLLEPVYFTILDGEYIVLNCLHGLHRFDTFGEVERWIKEQECRQHSEPIIHWYDWYVMKGGELIEGYAEPTPDEVVEMLRRYLTPA